MKRILGFIICSIGIILPWRLRIIYSELLGWISQSLYLVYFSILNFIIKSLKKEKGGGG